MYKRLKSINSKSAYIAIITVIAAVLMLGLIGCGKKTGYVTKQFFAMDTWMEIHLPAEYEEDELEVYFTEIEAMVRRLEGICSVTSSASDLYKLNNSEEETVSVEEVELISILRAAEVLEDLTDGAFCDKLYMISKEWGFTTGDYKIPDSEFIENGLAKIWAAMSSEEGEEAQVSIGEDSVTRPVGISFDLGGIAKGYATDLVVNYLREQGIESAIVNLGGNIYVLGDKSGTDTSEEAGDDFTVGITDPFDETVLCTLELRDKAVVTSGNYERYFELDGKRYHHIIDSATGYPADSGLVSVTIIADDATYADGLSTALFVMGLDKGTEFWKEHMTSFDVIFVTENKEIYYTAGIADKINIERDKNYDKTCIEG